MALRADRLSRTPDELRECARGEQATSSQYLRRAAHSPLPMSHKGRYVTIFLGAGNADLCDFGNYFA
jgi:hypothetical protein